MHIDLIMNTHPDHIKWFRLRGHHIDILYTLDCNCCDQPAHGHNINSLLIAKYRFYHDVAHNYVNCVIGKLQT